jgi:hypothetical protein
MPWVSKAAMDAVAYAFKKGHGTHCRGTVNEPFSSKIQSAHEYRIKSIKKEIEK